MWGIWCRDKIVLRCLPYLRAPHWESPSSHIKEMIIDNTACRPILYHYEIKLKLKYTSYSTQRLPNHHRTLLLAFNTQQWSKVTPSELRAVTGNTIWRNGRWSISGIRVIYYILLYIFRAITLYVDSKWFCNPCNFEVDMYVQIWLGFFLPLLSFIGILEYKT